MDIQSFYAGFNFDAHEYLGAHVRKGGVVFRTFAPAANHVEVLLEGRALPMRRIHDGNFYELLVPDVAPGATYEYRIYKGDGSYCDHCDPFGFQMELRPNHRSIVSDLSAYSFADGDWMASRDNRREGPLNIYEMHLGSWRRAEDGTWLTYAELAPLLVDYLTKAGYNYVEFMPLAEHPTDESWGYQQTGLFAPTSRYGTPQDLMALVDALHQAGIGAILDFVPVHFAIDDYGLGRFDGTALYEYPHEAVGVSEWGSYNFMHSRGEVRSLLQSSANYWMERYHFDGLRMDAISRIIFWQGDEGRGVNGMAVDFVKVMNKGLRERHPGCVLAAEDSTSYQGITTPVDQGGLGFDYKWDMGWMHDTLELFQTPPSMRTRDYHKLTFSMVYFKNEKYLLPLSHDEVVHGKATILQKMHGGYEGKFPQGRALYLYMYGHPGKKMNFMGSEFGQLREWDEAREQDWELLENANHEGFARYMADLSAVYLEQCALWQDDYRPEGFEWLGFYEASCVYAFARRGAGEEVVVLLNLSDGEQEWWLTDRYKGVRLTTLINSDWVTYGGNTSENEPAEVRERVKLAPFSGMMLKVMPA